MAPTADDRTPLHALPADGALAALGAQRQGLSGESAGARRAEAGPNLLPEDPPPSVLALAGRQLRDAMVLLLIGAAALSVALGEFLDAGVILVIVLLNTALGAIQEGRAEAAARGLESLLSPTATVARPGASPAPIDAAELVPGDVVLVRAGDRVPADGRLLDAQRLAIDEAPMTGESVPAEKRAEPPVSPDAPLADRLTMAYCGTTVARGEARLVVSGTGTRTELARIAGAASGAPPATPLQTRLDRLAAVILRGALVICVVLAALSWAHGESLGESVLVGASLAVAAVPEGLPAVVTITLAIGMSRLARRGAIVRRLRAVETLGSASVICTDKTGTLTTGRMAVERMSCVDTERQDGERDLLATALLASSELEDPGEAAIAAAGAAAGVDREAVINGAEVVGGRPFDADRKRMSVVLEDAAGARTAYVKGAPDVLAGRLAEPADGGRLLAESRRWADEGVRVMLVARRRDLQDADEAEEGLEAVGLIGLVDPVREGVGESVALAAAAGVRTIMITGDHPGTARAVARRCGIGARGRNPNVVTGTQLDELSQAELRERIGGVDVFARVVPEHKSRIVDALQRRADVVAMTGDGVNDAPALHAADVGVAIGPGGSDAAKAAADIVLTNNDFSTIVAAIEGGRRIYDNILHFIAFLLAANAGEVLLFALAVLPGLGAPLTIVQILLVNLLTDGLPAVALGVDPGDRGAMARPPRPRGQSLLRPLRGQLIVGGAATGAAAFTAFLIGYAQDAGAGRSMAFTAIVFAQLAYVYTVRGPGPLWSSRRNHALDAAVGLSALVAVAALSVPGLQHAFALSGLDLGMLAIASALALVPTAASETYKWARRRSERC
jgi:Ca2+-transporting ATPase